MEHRYWQYDGDIIDEIRKFEDPPRGEEALFAFRELRDPFRFVLIRVVNVTEKFGTLGRNAYFPHSNSESRLVLQYVIGNNTRTVKSIQELEEKHKCTKLLAAGMVVYQNQAAVTRRRDTKGREYTARAVRDYVPGDSFYKATDEAQFQGDMENYKTPKEEYVVTFSQVIPLVRQKIYAHNKKEALKEAKRPYPGPSHIPGQRGEIEHVYTVELAKNITELKE